MQFQGLSQSFGGASLPRDSHLVQALAAQEGDEALENDQQEERRLRRAARQHKREKERARLQRQRDRRPSNLESFLEEDEEHRDHHDEEQALLSGDDEEDSDDEDSDIEDHRGSGEASTSAAPARRKLSVRSGWSGRLTAHTPISPNAAAHANLSGFASMIAGQPSEFTPLLAVPSAAGNRKASISTLTPRPLQRLYKGPTVSPARKVCMDYLFFSQLSLMSSFSPGTPHSHMVHDTSFPHTYLGILAASSHNLLSRPSRPCRISSQFSRQYDNQCLRSELDSGFMCTSIRLVPSLFHTDMFAITHAGRTGYTLQSSIFIAKS
jgi:hypothetical protein